MLLNRAPLNTATLNGKASDTQSLAASAVLVCSSSAQTVAVTKNLRFLAASLVSATANAKLAIPISGSVQSIASIKSAAWSVKYFVRSAVTVSASAQAGLPMTKRLASAPATGARSQATASIFVFCPLAGRASTGASAAGGIIDVIPLGALHGTSAVANVIRADMALSVNLGATIALGVTAYGKAGIAYTVDSSVRFQVAVEAALSKIDNLGNLDGTSSITNIISAAMAVRKTLAGSIALTVVERHRFIVARTINATDYRGTYADVSTGQIDARVSNDGIYADGVELVLGQDLAMAA